MPTYEFRCPAGHAFDRLMKMSESVPELPCPECGATAVRQVSGGAGLVFKGSGFYLTDYGRNAHRTSGPASSGSATTGGESKPASGGESKASGGSEGKGSSEGKGGSGGASGSGSGSAGGSTGGSAGPSSSGGSGGSGGSAASGGSGKSGGDT